MKKISLCLFFLLVIQTVTYSQDFLDLKPEKLKEVKESIKNGKASAEIKYAIRKLLSEAKQNLSLENPSVVEKTINPPTSDKHDYLSVSRYWWPDPTKTDGLPWIKKDGKTNPDTQTTALDKNKWDRLCSRVRALSLAYYFTEEDKYAEKAASMINTYFLDPNTMMNPNLRFAQSVPGNPEERATGILDTRALPEMVLDSIILISKSKYWTPEMNTQMNQWLEKYLTWLTTSPTGIKGSKQSNNHGSWYNFNVGSVAYYLGKKDITIKAVQTAIANMDKQIAADGGQTLELERTKPFFYSCFNLEALLRVASLGDKVGINMWEIKTKNGAGLKKAVDFLVPFANERNWTKSTEDVDYTLMIPILNRIPAAYYLYDYDKTLQRIIKDIIDGELTTNFKKKELIEHYIQIGVQK